jgi:hypothetical protein
MTKANKMWKRLYIGVQRANLALRKMEQLEDSDYPKKEREAEARFIRGNFYFLLKILFKRVPYIDEKVPTDSIKNISNMKYSNNELWNKIADDFKFGVENLPTSQDQVGRPNKYTAEAYLAKVRLYQAYVEGDNTNEVTKIDKDDLNDVVKLTTDIIQSGKYGLFDDYAKDFLWKYENGKEDIFEIQRSHDDGTLEGRVDIADGLNYPMYPAYGCCSFHRPSFNLVNAFRTNNDGLPMFKNYNDKVMKDSADFQSHTFDPRLDHTVGIPSHPYKYKPSLIYRVNTFTRDASVYGPFSAMKEVVQPDCPCLTHMKAYAYPASSMNNPIIRYDDVLLWKAEALIQLGRQNEALPLINEIRKRAKHSKGRLKYDNGQYISNYHIGLYKPGVNIQWTKKNAFMALRWERRLEFGMEGERFFDLIRWGIAESILNKYFETEKNRVPFLDNAHFTKNKDEYLPIPQQQIKLSNGILKQIIGWK